MVLHLHHTAAAVFVVAGSLKRGRDSTPADQQADVQMEDAQQDAAAGGGGVAELGGVSKQMKREDGSASPSHTGKVCITL